MKGTRMSSEWRTIQLFLSDDEIAEVQADHHHPYTLKCSCRWFTKVSKCQHVKYVRENMQNEDGHYTVQITANIDPIEAALAMEDADRFRDFIIKYGKIEVL